MSSGIYKFVNKINGKIYIGQSQNLDSRFRQHFNNHTNPNLKDYNTKFYRALRKYGFDNFDYEIIEECNLEEINEREQYWVDFYNSFYNGYNSNKGGEKVTERGELHPCAILTNREVMEIKDLLKNTNFTQYELANLYSIGQGDISNINTGKHWSSVGEYEFPIRKQKKRYGEKSSRAILSDDTVKEIRMRYVNETAAQIHKDFSDICSLKTIEKALNGITYSHLPVYSKKKKQWIKK